MSERILTATEISIRDNFIAGVDGLNLPQTSERIWYRQVQLLPDEIEQLPQNIRELLPEGDLTLHAACRLDAYSTTREIRISSPDDSFGIIVWADQAIPLTNGSYADDKKETIPLYDNTEEGIRKTVRLAEILLQLAKKKFSDEV